MIGADRPLKLTLFASSELIHHLVLHFLPVVNQNVEGNQEHCNIVIGVGLYLNPNIIVAASLAADIEGEVVEVGGNHVQSQQKMIVLCIVWDIVQGLVFAYWGESVDKTAGSSALMSVVQYLQVLVV